MERDDFSSDCHLAPEMTLMMRRLLQPLWVLLAVIFLIEAWLWDHLEPIVARIAMMNS